MKLIKDVKSKPTSSGSLLLKGIFQITQQVILSNKTIA
jgi:hypothetical protein